MVSMRSIQNFVDTLNSIETQLPKFENTRISDEFAQELMKANSQIQSFDQEIAKTFSANKISEDLLVESSNEGFEELKRESWLVNNSADSLYARPSMQEFSDATGCSTVDAVEFVYGVVGSNLDMRNWQKIMTSSNPINAARAATYQLYNSDLNYATRDDVKYLGTKLDDSSFQQSLNSKKVLNRYQNFAEIDAGSSMNEILAVTSTGIILRGAGSSDEQVKRTAWLFGFDATQLLNDRKNKIS